MTEQQGHNSSNIGCRKRSTVECSISTHSLLSKSAGCRIIQCMGKRCCNIHFCGCPGKVVRFLCDPIGSIKPVTVCSRSSNIYDPGIIIVLRENVGSTIKFTAMGNRKEPVSRRNHINNSVLE